MRVDYCEYSRKIDDSLYFCRYAGVGNCPYDKCEAPPPKPIEEPKPAEINMGLFYREKKPRDIGRRGGRKSKVNFDEVYPEMLKLREQGKKWEEIALYFEITPSTLCRMKREHGQAKADGGIR